MAYLPRFQWLMCRRASGTCSFITTKKPLCCRRLESVSVLVAAKGDLGSNRCPLPMPRASVHLVTFPSFAYLILERVIPQLFLAGDPIHRPYLTTSSSFAATNTSSPPKRRRVLLILGREMGLELEESDVRLEPVLDVSAHLRFLLSLSESPTVFTAVRTPRSRRCTQPGMVRRGTPFVSRVGNFVRA